VTPGNIPLVSCCCVVFWYTDWKRHIPHPLSNSRVSSPVTISNISLVSHTGYLPNDNSSFPDRDGNVLTAVSIDVSRGVTLKVLASHGSVLLVRARTFGPRKPTAVEALPHQATFRLQHYLRRINREENCINNHHSFTKLSLCYSVIIQIITIMKVVSLSCSAFPFVF
jgi:hypothetical protein